MTHALASLRRRRRPSTMFKNLLKNAWPIKAKSHVKLPLKVGRTFCVNGPGHMTKITAMPLYGTNLQK